MRKLALAGLAILTLASPASALDRAMKLGLMKLDPETRLEQRCDTAVLDQIGQDDKSYKPDRVVAYATQNPKMDGNEIRTRGGAVRSKGQWYHLAFKCLTAADHMEVLSLQYKIGDKIAQEDWTKYNLYP